MGRIAVADARCCVTLSGLRPRRGRSMREIKHQQRHEMKESESRLAVGGHSICRVFVAEMAIARQISSPLLPVCRRSNFSARMPRDDRIRRRASMRMALGVARKHQWEAGSSRISLLMPPKAYDIISFSDALASWYALGAFLSLPIWRKLGGNDTAACWQG